ncbi:MAG: low-specificity L-threonine aldolase [Anaerolineae bacterium]|nr:MAG: low-specificity L-threonine aldolase [Anaerolineae bacterium]
MKLLDFRSDTVTLPSEAMRKAMAEAELGDDVYGDDPTVNRLQDLAAEMTGKEAGLFVPSGTMGNLAALLAHCQRGDEVIVGDQAHTYIFEAGGMAALGGIHPRVVKNLSDGRLDLEEVRAAVRPDDAHFPVTRLLTLENTHNRCGGAILSPSYMKAAGDLAHELGLQLHLDGARIFNASVALGVDVKVLTGPADSVMFCLSKGLAAPVGSVLCGSKDFILRAHRARKQLGGGMRQAGVLAAAGILALTQMVERLDDDHRQARQLAKGLSEVAGIQVESLEPPTNMVYFQLMEGSADAFRERCKKAGLLVGVAGGSRFRMVTHYGIEGNDVKRAIDAIRDALSA